MKTFRILMFSLFILNALCTCFAIGHYERPVPPGYEGDAWDDSNSTRTEGMFRLLSVACVTMWVVWPIVFIPTELVNAVVIDDDRRANMRESR